MKKFISACCVLWVLSASVAGAAQQLMAVVKFVGFNGDGTCTAELSLSQISGATANVEVVFENPTTALNFKTSLKQAARAKALQIWGIDVNNAQTLLVGE